MNVDDSRRGGARIDRAPVIRVTGNFAGARLQQPRSMAAAGRDARNLGSLPLSEVSSCTVTSVKVRAALVFARLAAFQLRGRSFSGS
jgi:hypothetical protein